MKDIVKWIILAVALTITVAGAAVLYNKLGDQYKGDNLVTEAPQETSDTTITQSDEEESPSESTPQLSLAPDFTVLNANGESVKLSDYFGKPIVLNFWATWCYYCKEEMPDFNEAYKLYPEVQFLMVNATDGVQETLETAKKYIESNGFEFEVLYDTQLDALNAYGINSFPQTFFINASGELVARGTGMLDLETLKKGIGMITE